MINGRNGYGLLGNNKKKVLVAEDNDTCFELYKYIFNSFEGVSLLRAMTGEESVTSALDNDISLVVMDIHLPVLDGYTASSKIKNAKPYLPILGVSALNPSFYGKDISVFDKYVSKPLEINDFKKVVKDYLK